MVTSRWLIDEYVSKKLRLASRVAKRFSVRDFKLLFLVPVEDERICEIAKELGFRVSKKNKALIIEIGGKKTDKGR